MSSSSEGMPEVPAGGETVALRLILAGAGAVLADQGRGVEALHEAVVAAPAGERGMDAVRAAQGVDVIAQHLAALSTLLADLAALPAVEGIAVPAPVLDRLPLAELSARLRGAAPIETGDEGDFELL